MTEEVVLTLRRVNRAINMRSRFLARQYGLTGPQLIVLKEIALHSVLPVTAIARAVHLSQATVTGILDRLERRSLVDRRRGAEDRRQNLIRLTPAGEEMLSKAPPFPDEGFTDRFRRLADWEQTQILSSLQRVVSLMEPPAPAAGESQRPFGRPRRRKSACTKNDGGH